MLTLVNTSGLEPVTTSEAKTHLHISSSSDDTYIGELISVARDQLESEYDLAIINATWDYNLDEFPAGRILQLPIQNIQSISSITYIDGDGASQAVTSSDYVLDKVLGRVEHVDTSSWPETDDRVNAVSVKFIAGYDLAFTASTDDTITCTAHGFSDGHRVRVKSTGTLPAGLSAATDYYIVSSATNTFSLATTPSGSAIDITDTGSAGAKHYLELTPFKVKQAILMLLSHYYANRESTSEMNIKDVPLAHEYLMKSTRREKFF